MSGELDEIRKEYKRLFGCYPEVVKTDAINMTRVNSSYLKEWSYCHTGRPLGRKPENETLCSGRIRGKRIRFPPI